jgi:hypothetical protein
MPKKVAATEDVGDDNTPGACFITDKQSGEQKCHLLTPKECDAQGGVFFGGPCGPFAEAVERTPLKGAAPKKKKAKKKVAPKKKKPE